MSADDEKKRESAVRKLFREWRTHLSDCAVYNGPALPPGKCDCAAKRAAAPKAGGSDAIERADHDGPSSPSVVRLPKGWFLRDVRRAAKRAAMWAAMPKKGGTP